MFPAGASEAGILRPFFAAAQRPYIPTLVPPDHTVELQGGEAAEHLGDRELELASYLGRTQSEHIGEVRKDAIPLNWDPDSKAARRLEGVVQDLMVKVQHREHVAGVLDKPCAIPEEPVRAHGLGREDAAGDGHYLFM